MTTPEQLAELDALINAAVAICDGEDDWFSARFLFEDDFNREDAEYIAAMRPHLLLDLSATIKALRADLAAEREACAKVAESVAWSNRDGHMIGTAHNVACRDLAAAIRARSASDAGGPSQ